MIQVLIISLFLTAWLTILWSVAHCISVKKEVIKIKTQCTDSLNSVLQQTTVLHRLVHCHQFVRSCGFSLLAYVIPTLYLAHECEACSFEIISLEGNIDLQKNMLQFILARLCSSPQLKHYKPIQIERYLNSYVNHPSNLALFSSLSK